LAQAFEFKQFTSQLLRMSEYIREAKVLLG